ncbi:MAG: deoxyribodipyrimidine photo-lyase [Burkholderiales bacterium]
MPATGAALVWFRRDLRDHDHAALHAALTAHEAVHCAFVFDRGILDALPSRKERRVEFLHASVAELKSGLERLGGGLHALQGHPQDEIPRLARRLGVTAVYANRDYEPAAIARDAGVAAVLAREGIGFHTRKDQVVFELDEVRTRAGGAFSVYTPYRNAWLKKLAPFHVQAYPVARHAARLAPAPDAALPTLDELGFARTDLAALGIGAGMSAARALFDAFRQRIDAYRDQRDFPAREGTSRLSVHLRFGTLSIRELAGFAWRRGGAGSDTWLSELIWRDFYFMILAARPDVVDSPFRREYARVRFDFRDDWWQAWCEGNTGYPLVDAAMRQLNRTGYMHNRLRMLTASFLVKHLGIDWRHGERYFAARLNDYELASNNGGWQWAASTGCDAQPWFRIFNPVTQSERFDADGMFIRRYVPELADVPLEHLHAPWTGGGAPGYPAPIVEHAEARKRTLERFGVLKQRA